MDFDNDGWKDLFIAQSHVMDTIEINEPHLHYKEPPALLWNDRGDSFVDVSPGSGEIFSQKWVGRGLATGDIDNDGRLDVVVTSNDGPAWVLKNETTTTNHWITLKLVGTKSNRDGIGAQIKLSTDIGDQYATVTTAGSYQSSSDVRVHFGLGAAATIKLLHVRWPSGIVQDLKDVKANQILTVTEPSASAKQPN